MGGKPPGRIEPKIFLEEGIHDIITCFKFGDDRLRGLASAEGQILPFPIDFDGRPYNTLTLPRERVISVRHPCCHGNKLTSFGHKIGHYSVCIRDIIKILAPNRGFSGSANLTV